ncbi:MAG: ribonuclease III [Dehalococcoidales bacterium]|nr:ribonuclease III [Dehalococcoidales bacterium]MDP6577253.1 ribonuclease III [Dehalococcoidales bacterium]
MADLKDLQATLRISFRMMSLLEQAVVHSSFANENSGMAPISNERLEFLGDAILGFIVAERLYQAFPDLTEGGMTRLRSALVRRDTLVRVARTIHLGDYLYLGKGEEAGGGRHKPINLSGTLEAVIGAVFLDRGLAAARKVILRLFSEELWKVVQKDAGVDYKSRLQELIQSRYQLAPAYRLVEASGPDHARAFTMEVTAGAVVLGRGSGKNKKMAETEAARQALERPAADFTR